MPLVICRSPCFAGVLTFGLLVASFSEPVQAVDTEGSTSKTPALASAAKEILRARCFECHGGSAKQADLEVLDHHALLEQEMVIAGRPDASPLLTAVTTDDEDVRMPQGLPALASSDIDTLRKWILEGAEAFPQDVDQPAEAAKDPEFQSVAGVEYVLKEILRHQRTLSPVDRRNTRYFSCNHLLTGGATRDELDLQRRAFAKAINHLSREPQIVLPTTVNGETATIFAVDIRELGWHRRPFKVVAKPEGAPSDLNLYDLVLLEYPYGILYEDSVTFESLSQEYLVPSALVRPIPFVRMDWFCSVVLLPPLYHDLLQLPPDLAGLEKQLGIATDENLKMHRAKRAGMTVSGVSRNNRAVERHAFSHGAYWKSIDYASSKGTENIFTDPVHLRGTGGEMVFNLPNSLQGYYISDGVGKRLDDAPTSIVTDKFAEDKTVRNGLSCIRCHDRGIKDFRDDVRPAVEKISGSGRINKREVLALYPPHAEMKQLVEQDQTRFLAALQKLDQGSDNVESLTSVSKRFLDTPLQLRTVTGELGLTDPDELKTIFRQPHFTGFGLVALADAGVVRRDMWEDYFDQVVRSLGLGVPVVPIDSVTRSTYVPSDATEDVHLATSRNSTVMAPGDEFTVLVENRGRSPIFIELYGTSSAGQSVVLAPTGTKVEAGKTFKFPETGTLKVQPTLGKEKITLFASETQFPAGVILRGENIPDRIVHSLYALASTDRGVEVRSDAKRIVKRTLEIETR